MTVINENELYSLILSSKFHDAKKFKRWVTSEVLPTIRKTRSYYLPENENQIAAQNSVEIKLLVDLAFKDIEVAVEIAERIYGVKRGIALASCKNAVEKNHGVDLSAFNNNKSGHSGYQIKWSAAVFSFFELVAA